MKLIIAHLKYEANSSYTSIVKQDIQTLHLTLQGWHLALQSGISLNY